MSHVQFVQHSTDRKIGNSLLRKLVKAIPAAITHRRVFEEFDDYLRRDKSAQVDAWEKQYAAWDEKPTGSPCLFDMKESCKCCYLVNYCIVSYRPQQLYPWQPLNYSSPMKRHARPALRLRSPTHEALSLRSHWTFKTHS